MDSSASTILTCYVVLFPIPQKVSLPLFIGILQGIAAGIGISNFLRAFFHDVLEVLILKFNEEDTT